MSSNRKSKIGICLLFLSSVVFLSLTLASLTNLLKMVPGAIIISFWLLSITFVTLLAAKLNLPVTDSSKKKNFEYKELFLVSAILLLSFVYLIRDIGNLPYVVHGDEAEQAVNARDIMETRPSNIFTLGWYDIPYMSFLLNIPAIYIFGFNLYGLRITSVVEGLVVILATFYLAKLVLKDRFLAALSSLTLLTTPTFIHFARSGASYMQAVSAVSVAIYFYIKTLESKNKYFNIYLAGLVSGFGFLLYYAARVSLFIILLSIPLYLLTKKISFKHVLLFLFGFFVVIAPYIPVWVKNPETFNSRTSQVLIFNQWNHVTGGQPKTPVFEVLASQIYKTLSFFVSYPDRSEQFGIQNGGFTIPLTVFLIIGLGLITYRLFKNYNFVLFLWFFSCIGAVFITIDAPFAPRMASIAPVVSIIAIYGVQFVMRILEFFSTLIIPSVDSPKRLFLLAKISLTMLVVMIFVFFGTNKYFVSYKSNQPDDAYTVIGRFLAENYSVLKKKQICIFTDQDLLAKYSTLVLLAPEAKIEIVDLKKINNKCETYIFEDKFEENVRLLTNSKKLRSLTLKNHDGREIFRAFIP